MNPAAHAARTRPASTAAAIHGDRFDIFPRTHR